MIISTVTNPSKFQISTSHAYQERVRKDPKMERNLNAARAMGVLTIVIRRLLRAPREERLISLESHRQLARASQAKVTRKK